MTRSSDSAALLRRVWYFPLAGAAVVSAGFYVHTWRLFLTAEEMVARIMTPRMDLAMFLPMLFTAICMVAFARQVKSPSRWRNVFYWVVAGYFWISVPIHLRAQITQSTDFVFAFPQWYSLVMLPWMALQFYYFVTIAAHAREGQSVSAPARA
jgi:hypothetical protein